MKIAPRNYINLPRLAVGERPDVWLPLTMQSIILPGRDWLHDDPVGLQKAMWLHVFGRLKPGISYEQAQAAANLVFQQGCRHTTLVRRPKRLAAGS